MEEFFKQGSTKVQDCTTQHKYFRPILSYDTVRIFADIYNDLSA